MKDIMEVLSNFLKVYNGLDERVKESVELLVETAIYLALPGHEKNLEQFMIIAFAYMDQMKHETPEITKFLKENRCSNQALKELAFRTYASGLVGTPYEKYHIARGLYAVILCCRYGILDDFSKMLDDWMTKNINERFADKRDEMRKKGKTVKEVTDSSECKNNQQFLDILKVEEEIMKLKETIPKKNTVDMETILKNISSAKQEFND